MAKACVTESIEFLGIIQRGSVTIKNSVLENIPDCNSLSQHSHQQLHISSSQNVGFPHEEVLP